LQKVATENFKSFQIVSGYRIRLFNVFIKTLSCVLYCVRVVHDSRLLPSVHLDFNLCDYLFWVGRNTYLWLIQTFVALVSLSETIIVFYISYEWNICRLFVNAHFLLELVTSFPFIITIFFRDLRIMYVPVFLNCWLAKGSLHSMMNDLNRGSLVKHSALFRHLLILFSTLICLIFTGMCSIEHLQRAGERQFDLFTSFYFVMVTFSTVGYGDWYPDTWMSRLCVIILICVALVLLPSQLEALGQTWIARQKCGSDYSGGFSKNEKHVVVTITHLEMELVRDFLDEFYAHHENKRVHVILLSPAELDDPTRLLLKFPLYSERVHYVRGTALRDENLERARLGDAQACFILSARHQDKKIITDEHTILRSWAVKDFAPHVKQYVQIFRPETKMHVEHAEVLICEDEFKYALLANNCICPGISTFITLLMHTSKGDEGKKSSEPWHKVYGFHSGNEIYMIKAEDSKFFGSFIGKSFTCASYCAHNRYGVGLIAVKSDEPNAKILLNPGGSHIIKSKDTLYYMALTNEESLYNFHKDLKDQKKKADLASTIANVGKYFGRKLVFRSVQSYRRNIKAFQTKPGTSSDSENEDSCDKCKGPCIKLQRSYPQVRTYIGTSNTVCHMLKQKRPICCLQLNEPCEHCPYTSAHEYGWSNKPIILAADRTSTYYRQVHKLHPIVLLLELEETSSPSSSFLDAISYFPLIYWMHGKMLDNLLRAGVSNAEHVVVVKEFASLAEEHLADCSTIITVQKIHRMFPRLRMITELTHTSNMRFVQFSANNPYSLAQSKFEKNEKKRGSHMPYMFRLPFAQGGVFSANMLDRLLYQAIIKPYVVTLTRLLLGIDQSAGSGYLSSVTFTV
uniref:Potassium channel subfamily T member 1 n=1 Tax=Haemonchus placei TaxID=6290 RepID=A0A158QPF5_HAEPC